MRLCVATNEPAGVDNSAIVSPGWKILIPRTHDRQRARILRQAGCGAAGALHLPASGHVALLEPSSSDKKVAHSDRLRIAQQRIDYVVCNKRCEVVAVVELDDRTHSRAKDKVRDERLAGAGIRTVRFQARQKPAADAIRAAVLPAAAPAAAPAPAMPVV